MREVEASVENVVGEDKVSAKTTPLERKKKDSVDEVVFRMGVPVCLYAVHHGDAR